jgi:UPF0271 protein
MNDVRAPITIDLNADLGEGFGNYQAGPDEELLALVSSANLACGFHGGDPLVMRAAVARAAALGVAIGAHPGYRDLAGFGRRFVDATPDEVYTDTLYQIGALAAFCRAAGAPLRHMKAHGALYNRAATDPITAAALMRAVRDFDPDLAVFAPAGSAQQAQAEAIGLRVVAEVFADRAMNRDGSLVSRRLPGSMIDDPAEAAARAVRMARDRRATAIDGTELMVVGETICLHGDAPGALDRARAIRAALEEAGITIAAPAAG